MKERNKDSNKKTERKRGRNMIEVRENLKKEIMNKEKEWKNEE